MSNRTERRAAERIARKSERTKQITAESVTTQTATAAAPDSNADLIAALRKIQNSEPYVDELLLDPELDAIVERVHPGDRAERARIAAVSEGYRAQAAEQLARLTGATPQPVAAPLSDLLASLDHDDHEDDINLAANPTRTTSQAQIDANRANSKLSTGPTSRPGQIIVSFNRQSHGLTGRFMLLESDNPAEYEDLIQSVYAEHKPESDLEYRLANAIITHYFLMQRAISMQERIVSSGEDADSKKLSLFLRYQTTHERSYYRAIKELQNLQKAKRRDEIGFESQKRQQECHEAKVRLTHARAQNLEIDTACRQTMEAPIPGNTKLSFEELTHACSTAIATVVYQNQMKNEATGA